MKIEQQMTLSGAAVGAVGRGVVGAFSGGDPEVVDAGMVGPQNIFVGNKASTMEGGRSFSQKPIH